SHGIEHARMATGIDQCRLLGQSGLLQIACDNAVDPAAAAAPASVGGIIRAADGRDVAHKVRMAGGHSLQFVPVTELGVVAGAMQYMKPLTALALAQVIA